MHLEDQTGPDFFQEPDTYYDWVGEGLLIPSLFPSHFSGREGLPRTMSPATLDELLDQFHAGNADAAQQLFRAFVPCVRLVVRRRLPARLREEFDASDVMRRVETDFVNGCRAGAWRFEGRARVRAFLVKVVRDRFLERTGQKPADASHPAVARAEERWERLLRLCPPDHRGLVQMRRQGLLPAEIAVRLRLPEAEVRRILGDLACRLACPSTTPVEPASD
jgi:DNA-directed RNA polymerase specialized sigma24 family protein